MWQRKPPWPVRPRRLSTSGSAGSVTALDPLLEVRGLGADGGLVTVAGAHDRLRRQVEDRLLQGGDDRVEGGVGASRRTRSTPEEGVTGEQLARLRQVQAHRARRVAGDVEHLHVGAGDVEDLAVVHGLVFDAVVGLVPEHLIAGVEQNRGVEHRRQLRGDGDVVVVAVGADDALDPAAGHLLDDGGGVVGGVDDVHPINKTEDSVINATYCTLSGQNPDSRSRIIALH